MAERPSGYRRNKNELTIKNGYPETQRAGISGGRTIPSILTLIAALFFSGFDMWRKPTTE
jgi:hypothetical protein